MTAMLGTHVDPVTMVDYVRGRLSRQRAAAVRRHCHDCTDCGDQLAAVMLLRQHAEVEARPARWRPLAAAAAIVLLAGAAVLAAAAGGLTSIGTGLLPVAEGSLEAPVSDAVAALDHLPTALRDPEFRARAGRVFGFVIRYSVGESVPASGDAPEGILQAARASIGRADFATAAERLAPFAQRLHPIGTPLHGIALYLAGHTTAAEPVLVDAYRYLMSLPAERRETSTLSATRLVLGHVLVERDRITEAVEILEASLQDLEPEEAGDRFQRLSRALLQEITPPEE